MFNQPLTLEVMANEHRNDLLKQAETHRQMRQVKRRHPQATWLKGGVTRSILSLRELASQAAVQASLLANGIIPASKRE